MLLSLVSDFIMLHRRDVVYGFLIFFFSFFGPLSLPVFRSPPCCYVFFPVPPFFPLFSCLSVLLLPLPPALLARLRVIFIYVSRFCIVRYFFCIFFFFSPFPYSPVYFPNSSRPPFGPDSSDPSLSADWPTFLFATSFAPAHHLPFSFFFFPRHSP